MNESAVSTVDMADAAQWRASLNTNQSQALKLLGQGISAVIVASTLGVTEGLISQFLAEPRFAEEVTRLKLAALQKQTSVDNKYLEFEDKLLDKFGKVIPLMTKPMEILKGLQVLNATKRRGMADAPAGTGTSQIVQINIPVHVSQKFITNTHNQIVEIHYEDGSRSLVTATPQAVERLAASRAALPAPGGVSGDETSLAEIINSGLNRMPEISNEPGWQASATSADILASASQRLSEPGVSETISKGLRRSFENKGQITSDDL